MGMGMRSAGWLFYVAIVLVIWGCSSSHQDAAVPAPAPLVLPNEGMWLPNALPGRMLKDLHHFEATQEWMDHLRLASVRFNGASGSFVSSEGLVLTNQHVVA